MPESNKHERENCEPNHDDQNTQAGSSEASYSQCKDGVQKNKDWFLNNIDDYTKQTNSLTVYQQTYTLLTNELKGIEHLLDIGNGGVFNYDTSIIPKITANGSLLGAFRCLQLPSKCNLNQW